MANELVAIPESIRALIASGEFNVNDDMLDGISTGAPPRISIRGGKFRLIDGNGDEIVLKPSDLVEGEFLPIVALKARRAVNKAFYAKPYGAGDDPEAPDCYSTDGEKPDSGVQNPQCTVCANCAYNAFGSAVASDGSARKGKRCTDSKIVAVFYKSKAYKLAIPPGSFKNWGLYVKDLSAAGIPVSVALTLVGFDEAADGQVLTFKRGGWLNETQIAKIAEVAKSAEVEDIINPRMTPSVAKPAAPAPKEQPKVVKAAEVEVDIFEEENPKEEAKPKPAKPKVVKAEPKAAEAANVPTDDELMADLFG